ncbi:hypothetical protein H9X78_07415 [Clostridium saudiense]|nr:hypothetical protein [Clostridium saudiense]
MIVSIKSEGFNLTLPIPLSMGSVAIKCIPNKFLNTQEKKLALQLFKSVKGTLKDYKGLKIVEVISHNGEHILVKI